MQGITLTPIDTMEIVNPFYGQKRALTHPLAMARRLGCRIVMTLGVSLAVYERPKVRHRVDQALVTQPRRGLPRRRPRNPELADQRRLRRDRLSWSVFARLDTVANHFGDLHPSWAIGPELERHGATIGRRICL
jgi:hypothetical protein